MMLDAQRIAERFAMLMPEARRRFIEKLAANGLDFTELPIIKADRKNALPLSFAQRGLWLTWQMDQESPAYNMPGLLHLNGKLDHNALEKSLYDLVERHETLRTIIHIDIDGEPKQRILPAKEIAFSVTDLRGLAPEIRMDEANLFARAFAIEPFKLDAQPPFRVVLIQLDDESNMLVMALHHIAADAWSLRLLINELMSLYIAYADGKRPTLPVLPIQFADYAVWQRNWLSAGEYEHQLAYWQSQLGDEHPVMVLPFDRPRGLGASPEGRKTFSLPVELSERLRTIARTNDASLYMVILSIFGFMLYRYTGQADLRIGAPIANRNRAETQGLIGYLTNVQILRLHIDPSRYFMELLVQVRKTLLDAQTHGDLPFDALVDALAPVRQVGVHPLFQVKCTQQTPLQAQYDFAGLRMCIEELPPGVAHFDLSFDFTDRPGGIEGIFSYAANLFDEETIGRFIEAFVSLADQISSADTKAMDDLCLPGPLSASIGDRIEFADKNVLSLWERYVRSTPTSPAVRDEEGSYTYAELNIRAEGLAAHLREYGIGPESRVAIYAPRGRLFVLSMLAVLKAGGVFVPLDPQLPAERLAYQLADSGAKLMLAVEAPEWHSAVPVIKISTFANTLSVAVAAQPLQVCMHPQQAAYVIYTSGSTGKPKGVVITHATLASYVQGLLTRLALTSEVESMAMVSTVAADLGHTVLFGALCSGRLLYLIAAERVFDADSFAEYMREHRVDVLKIVPSHLQALLQAAEARDVLPMHTLIVGGEATSWSLLERIRTLRPECKVINHYGPTETTIGALTRPMSEVENTTSPPIGHPLPNTDAYVLDTDLNLVPEGSEGELYIGGTGVARGYEGRAALSADRFIASPFAPGERLYRSGDRAKLSNGDIFFLGRMDDQVKIRGYRVEPREVAAVISLQQEVRAAEVIGESDEDGRTTLYGYVVIQSGHIFDADALRNRLAKLLPDYMVPTVLMALDELPLTANGKIDRRRLPKPSIEADQLDTVSHRYDAPEGEIEKQLSAIWAAVLRVEKVGRQDNFFELGGDSILALQIIARARKAGIKLSPKHLMEHKTVAAVAALAQKITMPGASASGNNRTMETEGEVSLTPVQHWFFEQRFANPHHWNQAVWLEMDEPIDASLMTEAIKQLADMHDALRLRFIQEDGRWHQRYTSTPSTAFTLVPLESEDAVNIVDVINDEANAAHRSLHLNDGPILRAIGFNRRTNPCGRLLMICHHLVVDGVSWRVLLNDLQRIYRALKVGRPVDAQATGNSFKQWSQALIGAAEKQIFSTAMSYWQRQMNDALASGAVNLPATFPHARNITASAKTITVVLDETFTHRLLNQAQLAYRTQADELLLTGLVRTLCEWTERSRILIELEGHGREDVFENIDVSGTVGWFTTLYPVCFSLDGLELCQSIKSIKEQLRSVPNRGLGYGVLRYLDSAENGLSQMPQPRVTFNYLGRFDQYIDAESGWRLSSEQHVGTGQARSLESVRRAWFDVNVLVQDNRLHLHWTFSENIHERATVEELVRRYVAQLEALVGHCSQESNGGITPSDFPLAGLKQAELDLLPCSSRQLADLYPLAPMQAGILFRSLYAAGNSAYRNQLRVDVENMDAGRFIAAWRSVVKHHEILRSGFFTQQDIPLQWIEKDVDLPVSEHDYRNQADLTGALDVLAAIDLAKEFDFMHPPLMRLALARVEEDRYHLVWTYHHLLLDGWSSTRLLGEVLRRYAGQYEEMRTGHYRDYIAWLQTRDSSISERYWRDQLQQVEEPMHLGSALPINGEAKHCKYVRVIDASATRDLLAFAKREQLTLNTLIQAAWALLLKCHTASNTVIFGVTTAGRPAELPDAEHTLGLFINTLPLIVSPKPEQKIIDWLHGLQTHNLTMREHEYTPLYEIQRWAGKSGQELFDSLIVVENYPIDAALQEAAPGGLRFSQVIARDDTHYAMTLSVVSTGHHRQSVLGAEQSLRLNFNYDSSRFSGERVQQLAAQMNLVLLQLIDNAKSKTISHISLLSDSDRLQLQRWSRCDMPYPAMEPVHRLIERHAIKRPDAVALLWEDRQIDYAELNRRANQLAHYLIDLGVGPETRVGLAIERSIEMVVSLLAVLKAGGAYVPLDPDYPAERLAYMVVDSGIELLLTQSYLGAQVPRSDGVTVLELDRLDAILAQQKIDNPDVAIQGEQLAYVIYTSGSTGKPKGAGNRHSALYNRLEWMQKAYRLTYDDTVLQKTPFSFDVSVWEFFWPLMVGARLAILAPGEHKNPLRLVDAIRMHRVTTVHFVPSMLQAFVAHEGIESCATLQRIICSGEALSVELQTQIFTHLPKVGLYNLYGPTEAAIDVMHWTCINEGSSNVPIGQPIANIQTHVLDAALNPVPQGVPGELYLGGIGLGRGYVNRPGLTAERFIADPFDNVGSRLYRTGDLARWRSDGQIEYLGRIDHQIKLRGFRIELGEIEAQLLSRPGVQEAVVVAKESDQGTRLIAYVSPADVDGVALRAVLSESLPDYMVPSAIIVLPVLPLNHNGKVDRKSLPDPTFTGNNQYESPQGEMEIMLADIWASVLGVSRVGRHDNFFELGGHSLLAMRLASRIKQEMNITVPLAQIFETPDLRRFTEKVSANTVNVIGKKLNSLDAFMDSLETA